MLHRHARLVVDSGEQGNHSCQRFHHSQNVADVLGQVDLERHRYLVVENCCGKILGVVETDDLLQKLASPDPVERQRWSEMPLEAAISARLDNVPQSAAIKQLLNQDQEDSGIRATVVSTCEKDLAALYVEDELYFPWSSIKNILQHALVDTVTGLPNRMVFERRLMEEWQRLERVANSLCVLLIDLDYFKVINDEYGHSVGDAVLREVGKTLERQLRSYDLLVRYGGDEFAAILSGCPASQLSIPIRRIQQGVRDLVVAEHSDLPPLSLSIGAVMIRSQQDVSSVGDLVREADVCLYQAKEHGRRCGVIGDLSRRDVVSQVVSDGLLSSVR